MKKTLLTISFILSAITGFAQATCDTAIPLTTNGTYTTGSFTGSTYRVVCYNTFTNPGAVWYTFTAPSNGEITISSNLPTNDGILKSNDTRISVMSGTCGGTLTCLIGNDDVSGTNLLSTVTNIPVISGTTYYFQWDNRWSNLSFDFSFTFTAVSCARPTVVYLPDYLSTSSADLYWDQTATTPSAGYDIDWSYNFLTPAGSGTLVNAPAGALPYSTTNLSGLNPSSNLRYFLRSNCGTSQSTWSGPYYAYLPVTLPYSNNFENASNNNTDGFVGFQIITTNGTSTPANYDGDGGAGSSMFTGNSTTANSNARAYFRGMSLSAGEVVTVQFKTRLYGTSPMTFNLTVGQEQSATGQSQIVQSYTNASAASYTTHTATFAAPTAGIYYFGIHNNTPLATSQAYLFLDSISLTTNLSVNDNQITNIAIYPNPATNVLNISNVNNYEIKNISVVDINGRVVKNESGAMTQINVSDLNAGVYFVTIEAAEGKTTKKFIKQ